MAIAVEFNGIKPKTSGKEFLIPFIDIVKEGFQGISSGKPSKYGLIVYIGIEINSEEVFKRLVSSGRKIDDVKSVLVTIDKYLSQIAQYKIGTVVSIDYKDDGSFEVVKEANRPPQKNQNRLP